MSEPLFSAVSKVDGQMLSAPMNLENTLAFSSLCESYGLNTNISIIEKENDHANKTE